MSAEDPGDINVDDLSLGDSGVEADVDISGGQDPGDIRVDVDGDSGGTGGGGGSVDAGGFGEELGGDPAGDADRDPGPGPSQPPGGGPETIEEPAPEPDPTQTDPVDRGQPPGAGPETIEDPEPVQGVEFAGSGVARRARLFEQQVEEQTGLGSEDIRIRREGDMLRAELTATGREIQRANLRGTLGGLLSDPADSGRRLISSIGADERGGRAPLVLVGRGEGEARERIREEFESDLGVEVEESDIEFVERDGQIVGSLTPEARQEIQVQQEPLVQLTQDTAAGPVFETGGRIGVQQAAQRSRRRQRLFGAIGQRERAEQFVEDIGLGEEREAFESLQASAQAELASLRQSVFEAGERGAAIAAAPVVLPLGIAADRTGTPPSALEELPDPSENPAAFAAAAAPVAAVEPTPFGEVAVGSAALVGGAAIAAERQQQRATVADLETAVEADLDATLEPAGQTAMAEPPGLFPPEQEQPTEAIGRGFFPADFPIGPSRQELPELLPPTDPQSGIQAGRLTPPEIEVPGEPVVDIFPAEVPTPQEPTGEGLFPPEQQVPTAQAAALIGETRETRQRVDRERRRRRRVPEEMIPSSPATIGGVDVGEGEIGPGVPGPTFIVRPDPRSMGLRRIETEEGEFEVGPELTRFLEAQTLERRLEPEIEPLAAAGVGQLPPPQEVGGEFAAVAAAQRQRTTELQRFDAFEDQLPTLNLGITPGTAQASVTDTLADQTQRQRQRTAQQTRTVQTTGTSTPGLDEAFPPENIELVEDPVEFPPGDPGFGFPEPPVEPLEQLIEPDAERRRRGGFDPEDFERRFEFGVADPLEFLEGTPRVNEAAPTGSGPPAADIGLESDRT